MSRRAIKRAGAEKLEISQGGEQGHAEVEGIVSREGAELGHVSVLLQQAIYFLNIDKETRRGGTYVDATLGLGGHSSAIAQRLGPAGRLICFDRDQHALRIAGERLEMLKSRLGADAPQIELVHAAFSHVGDYVADGTVDGLLVDFGVSSIQLDDPARGFSFRAEGPLDMRMDQSQSFESVRSADQVVNHLDEQTLADVIYEFGEERRSRRIARAIVRARPIRNTAHLAEVVSTAVPAMYKPGQKRIHPATKTFQAIRMFVNRELEEVEALLGQAPALLRRGGRLVAISFHSLEDRRVKDHMREMAQQGIYELLTRKPATADEQELERNPRSRSAKLRAAEKV